jgi:hypothetical protein
VLISANLVATVLRFLAYRVWVFAPGRHGGSAAAVEEKALPSAR